MVRCNDDGLHNGDSIAVDINGWSDCNLKAVDRLTAMDSSLTVMDGAARRQWTARRLVDGDGWHDGSLMVMYGEGQR